MPKEPEFKALYLSPDIDGLFDTVKVIFTDLTKLNEELNTGIKEVMTDTTLLALEQKNKDLKEESKFPQAVEGDEAGNLTAMLMNAIAGARDAYEPAFTEAEIKKIRAEQVKPEKKGEKKANELAAKEMKTIGDKVLPKVDHSKAKEGIIEISLPVEFKMDALEGNRKPPMDTVKKLFDLVALVGNTKIKEIKTRIEETLKEIKEKASPSNLTAVAKDKTKDMGMGDKFKYMKEKGAEMGENAKSAAVLKDFMMVLLEKVKALGQMFVKGWMEAVVYAMKYEKDETFLDNCPAAPNPEVYFPMSFGAAAVPGMAAAADPGTAAAVPGAAAKTKKTDSEGEGSESE